MWASYLFNRAKPKPLVLAQAVKLCHYIRASQRPSAEGSPLWETVYPLLRVLLSGVSCNVTFRVTRSLKLEKYRCCSRSEGRQWCESSSKAKPWRKSMMGLKDAAEETRGPPCLAAGSVCFPWTEKERRKRSTWCKKQALWRFKKENNTKPAAQELRLHTRNYLQFS